MSILDTITFNECLKFLDEAGIKYSFNSLSVNVMIGNKIEPFTSTEEFNGFCKGLKAAKREFDK